MYDPVGELIKYTYNNNSNMYHSSGSEERSFSSQISLKHAPEEGI